MICIKITKNQIQRAKKLFKFGALSGSITNGKGNLLGSVGEVIVSDYYKAKGVKVDDSSTFNYDLILNGLTVDVKTRSINQHPKEHYEVRLPHNNTHQRAQYYLFVMIDPQFKKGWLIGYIKKDDYFKIARFYKKGTARTDGWKYRSDTYVITIAELELIS